MKHEHSQNHQAGKVGECIVRNVSYSVESQRQGLQGSEIAEWRDGNFCQAVVIQPKVPQLQQPLKAVLWYGSDVVSI